MQPKLLDHGSVTVIETMGDDAAIAKAARCSYGSTDDKTPEDDTRLIYRLMRDRHTSPFEMCEIKLQIDAPLFVARQWLRHRTANVNEMSGRYKVIPNKFYIPSVERMQKQSKDNHQGSEPELIDFPEQAQQKIDVFTSEAYDLYKHLLAKELTRELARMVLPPNVYTRFVWKIDLHNLFNFLRLRVASDAQWEIQVYARAIASYVEEWVPSAYAAFKEYSLESVTITQDQLYAMRSLVGASSAESTIGRSIKGEDYLKAVKLLGMQLKDDRAEPEITYQSLKE